MRIIGAVLLLACVAQAQYLKTGTATIASAQISGTLTNYPGYLNLSNSDLKTVANAGFIQNSCTQTVGNRSLTVPCDLVFASDAACSTLYSWEFEAYSATAGTAIVWVKIPSAADGSVVHICYDNAAVNTLQTTTTSVWDATIFQAVYHLAEDPSGTAPQMNDSTTHANHCTSNGTMTSGEQAAGKIGGSLTFNGTSQYLTCANASNFNFSETASYSVSGWFKMAANSSAGFFAKFDSGAASNNGWEIFQRAGGTTPTLAFEVDSSGSNRAATRTTSEWSTGVFHLFDATYDGSKSTTGILLYADGSSAAKTDIANTLTGTLSSTWTPTIAGRWSSGSGTTPAFFNGATFDEVRVYASGYIESAAWIAANYGNGNAPNTFFTIVLGTPVTPVLVKQPAVVM